MLNDGRRKDVIAVLNVAVVDLIVEWMVFLVLLSWLLRITDSGRRSVGVKSRNGAETYTCQHKKHGKTTAGLVGISR